MNKKVINILGVRVDDVDVKKQIIKNASDLRLFEKCRCYLREGISQKSYILLCKSVKCLRVLENKHPNSEYIFQCYKLYQNANKYLSKIA